jgi:hypothetical protein
MSVPLLQTIHTHLHLILEGGRGRDVTQLSALWSTLFCSSNGVLVQAVSVSEVELVAWQGEREHVQTFFALCRAFSLFGTF